MLEGEGGLVMKALGSSVVWVVASIVFVVVSALKSTLRAVFTVWEAISLVVGATWVLTLMGAGAGVIWVLTLVVVMLLVWVLALL